MILKKHNFEKSGAKLSTEWSLTSAISQGERGKKFQKNKICKPFEFQTKTKVFLYQAINVRECAVKIKWKKKLSWQNSKKKPESFLFKEEGKLERRKLPSLVGPGAGEGERDWASVTEGAKMANTRA